MKAAALLALLAALPARASDVTPAQARANVVQALPPDIAKNAGNGDLRSYLQRLSPEQKQAALRSLTAKGGELGDDPATLHVIGEAYAGLGKVKEARQTAQAALRQNPGDSEAKRLLSWAMSQEKLAERGAAGGIPGDSGPPAGVAPSTVGGRQAALNGLEQRIQGVFRRGQRSQEFNSTMSDARGVNVAELKAAGIQFQRAAADQEDAVMITQTDGGGFNVSIRGDALTSGGDTEARAAAHVANGVRQAQTKRDHPYIGGVMLLVKGWMTGASVHRELAPEDIDRRPSTPSDQNLMVSRKVLDLKTDQFDSARESYGKDEDRYLPMYNSLIKAMPVETIFDRLIKNTGRAR